MNISFPPKHGSGIDKLLPHASKECLDIIKLLLTYDPEKRITASHALKHEFFRDLYEIDQMKDFQNSLFFFYFFVYIVFKYFVILINN